ncbi:MAG: hypothetical protein QM772_03565 [Ottowia sp.]|uniref:hypothetical protein n=1 Tax=Ottowia sp. TaxID=1898956 RepID=UPI0039E72281
MFRTLLCAVLIASAAQAETLRHGPFEIVASGRRISTGTFPNQGGSPFATQEVTSFSLRWRGQLVQVPGRGDRFWQVLRLPDAPRPALLLVERDFTLVTEDGGQLKVEPLRSQSSSLAEAQWLDSEAGQPGEPMIWGIAKADMTQTALQGGRFLLLGSALVLDVQRLQLHSVSPSVFVPSGQPDTGLARDGDRARAFSPGRSQYVLAASQTDYARGDGRVHGLLVVDMARGSAYELRVDRKRMPFADTDDMDLRWINHYFVWRRDGQGQERLTPRPDARRLPWRGRLSAPPGRVAQYSIARVQPALLDVLRQVVLAQPGAASAPDGISPRQGIDRDTLRVGDCLLSLSASDYGRMPDEPAFVRLSVHAVESSAAKRSQCNETVARIAAAMDAELATGRHDRLVVLD